ncbi:MAG: transglycosylase SLT domain-containing protein [Muribaculaceae bacterium]|nr:transglycosylase SLT domain-containing protein [Muribaculaceae bacterium]
MKSTLIKVFIFSMLLTAGACGKKNSKPVHSDKTPVEATPDTLKAATLYGPTSYFNYRGQIMGFDYENVKRFAEDEGMILDLKIAPSLHALLKMVQDGEVDLAAYPVPYIEEYNKRVRHAGHKEVTWQVLVQPAGGKRISDVTQLVGKTVYVEKDSKYHYRLKNLDQELGGGIDIVPINKDSLITEDLIQMVDHGEIPLTVVDSDIAELNKSYYPRLDIGMKISLDQYSSWAVRNDCDSLAARLDRWDKKSDNSEMLRTVYKKYFEISKNSGIYEDVTTSYGLSIKNGRISPYDETFKRHAHITGYDWQLLAAIGYNESRFDNSVVSWAGAQGLMQLMPATARAMGISPESLRNPDANVLAAARLIKKLDSSLESKVADPSERMKFVIAAYNCGLGHIYDAIALAEKYGLDPNVWTGSVSEAALMKSRPQYYNCLL